MFSLFKSAMAMALRFPKAPPNLNFKSSFHLLLPRPSLVGMVQKPQLLAPVALNWTPDRGMKAKGILKRRCKDCYFVCRDQTWYVMCKTHGRHKQMQKKKKPRNTWVLSHATQSKVRPW